MLNRRHLRVKVLQCLYAFFMSDNKDLAAGEKELMQSIDKVYDMYLYQLLLLAELREQELLSHDDKRRKHLPSGDDLNPSRRFVDNQCLTLIATHESIKKYGKNRSIHWDQERDLVRRLMAQIRQQPYYQEYMKSNENSLADDVRFVLKMLKKDILPYEQLHAFYEDKSIYWIDDWELVNKMIFKTLKQAVDRGGELVLMELFKDASDEEFAKKLYHKTIINHNYFNEIISARTKNWDVERIAFMDMIIMEMALTEILKFPEIPVKVSLNEYIELSKMYSTPKSKVFVNGVLDKLVEEFVQKKMINPYTSGFSGEASE